MIFYNMANIPSIISLSISILAVIAILVLVILYFKGIIKIPKNTIPGQPIVQSSPQVAPVDQYIPPKPLKDPINQSSKPSLTPSVPPSKPVKIVQPVNSSNVTWKGLETSIKGSVDKLARDCIARGGIYTGGENKNFPGQVSLLFWVM